MLVEPGHLPGECPEHCPLPADAVSGRPGPAGETVIIDCHCHAGPGDGFVGPWDTAAPLDCYLPRAAAAGIAHTVLFPAFHSDYAVANRAVAAIVAADPGRFSGFAFVNPAADRGRVQAMLAE